MRSLKTYLVAALAFASLSATAQTKKCRAVPSTHSVRQSSRT